MPTVRRSRADLDLDKVDWDRIDAITDAEIERQVSGDPDLPPLFTEKDLADARRALPVDEVDVKRIRTKYGLTQREFADRFGLSAETVSNYERRHRMPRGPMRVLMKVIDREPDAVERALKEVTRDAAPPPSDQIER